MNQTIFIRTITEGRGDYAVLENIFTGISKIFSATIEIDSIRPAMQIDRTHRAIMEKQEFGNWKLVLDECSSGEKITTVFRDLEAQMPDLILIVIQIDTDKCDHQHYEVERPPKDTNDLLAYVTELRKRVIERINGCMNNLPEEIKNSCLYAVCVEEMESWILALDIFYENQDGMTDQWSDPKDRLKRRINKPGKFKDKEKKTYFVNGNEMQESRNRSKNFTDKKELYKARTRNHSLHLFLQEAEAMLKG